MDYDRFTMKKVRWLILDRFQYEDKTKKMKIDLDRFKIDLNWY